MEQGFIVILICSSILAVIGILVHHFKVYELMAGYVTMPLKEKRSINWNRFTLIFRNVLLSLAALMLIGFFLMDYYQINWYYYAVYIIIVSFGALFLIFRAKNICKYRNPTNLTNKE